MKNWLVLVNKSRDRSTVLVLWLWMHNMNQCAEVTTQQSKALLTTGTGVTVMFVWSGLIVPLMRGKVSWMRGKS